MKALRDLIDSLSRWQTTAALLGFYALALGAATWIEAALSTEAARAAIYHAWWMYVLYGALIANFVLISRKMQLLKRRRWGVLLLHYGFVAILLGAALTHAFGYEGTLHLREGDSSDRLTVTHTDRRELPFRVTLRDFRLLRYPGSHTPSSYESDVTIHAGARSREATIAMNRIARVEGFRLYQSSYDTDEQGSVLSVSYDPLGTPVTYAGYALLLFGLVVSLGQRGSRFRTLLHRLSTPEHESGL